ncbi:MAG TPA: hypothetical protein VJ323_13885, partial [Bryobacteraceae bacterium]|nr:hypothetical protein [Bryobacteraceae bacterium]
MHGAKRGSEAGQRETLPDVFGQGVIEQLHLFEDAMQKLAENARRNLADGFINRHNTAGMKLLLFVVVLHDFEFGLNHHHGQPAAIVFDLSKQRQTRTGRQPIHQMFSVEPAGEERTRAVAQRSVEESQGASLEVGQTCLLDTGKHRGLFTGHERAKFFGVAAVFIA